MFAKRIHEGRFLLEKKLPGIFNSHGSRAPQFISELHLRGFKERRHFGGTKFIIRGKYNRKALKFTVGPMTEADTERILRENSLKFMQARVGSRASE
jgi:hypothetical protein